MTVSLVWHFLVGFWIASEIYIAVKTRTRQGEGTVSDRGSMLLLWIVIFSSITASEWISHRVKPTLPGGHSLKLAGVLILAAALIIRWSAVRALGKAFSANVAVREGQTIQRSGLYGMVRHPSYLGLVLAFLAIGVHAGNWISLVIAVVPTTAALLYRIHVEEAALRAAFGEEYVAYSRTTRRLIPGIY